MTTKLAKYQGILLDLDGTMVDNMPVHLSTWVELLKEMDVEITDQEFHHRFAGQTNHAIFRALFGDRFSAEQIAKMAAYKEALYRERYAAELRPIDGLPELLDLLEKEAIPVAVASSGPTVNVSFVIDALGWRKRFGAITTGDDITHCKPHPEAFLITAEKLGIRPEECLVFEDAPSGIESAHRAGMEIIALTTTMPESELCNRPSVIHVCNDFHQAMHFLTSAAK